MFYLYAEFTYVKLISRSCLGLIVMIVSLPSSEKVVSISYFIEPVRLTVDPLVLVTAVEETV